MNAIAYIRVSTAEQARDGLSLEAQESRIRAYCQAYDLNLLDVVRDNGKSAKDIKGRPGMRVLLQHVERRSYFGDRLEAVVVYKLDRMFRSALDGLETFKRFAAAGIAFHSVVEQWNTDTAAGRFALNMVLALAQLEREQVGERTRDVLRATKQSPGGSAILDHRKAEGKLVVGQAPYGFQWVGRKGRRRLQPKPEEMILVERIFEMRRSGTHPAAIARTLTAEGHRTRHKGMWLETQVRRILERDYYEATV